MKVKFAFKGDSKGGSLKLIPESSNADDWDTCAEDSEACEANATLVGKLCTDITLVRPNPAVEGRSDAAEYAEGAREEIKDGDISVSTSANASPTGGKPRPPAPTRILEANESGSGYVAVDETNGADMSSSGDFESGDSEDADPSNAVDEDADKEVIKDETEEKKFSSI